MYDGDINRKALSPSPKAQSPNQLRLNSPEFNSERNHHKIMSYTKYGSRNNGQVIEKSPNASPSLSFNLKIKKPVIAKSKVEKGALPNINLNKSKFK